eukprot:360786-Chlamydomonas_euryale.AAC.2
MHAPKSGRLHVRAKRGLACASTRKCARTCAYLHCDMHSACCAIENAQDMPQFCNIGWMLGFERPGKVCQPSLTLPSARPDTGVRRRCQQSGVGCMRHVCVCSARNSVSGGCASSPGASNSDASIPDATACVMGHSELLASRCGRTLSTSMTVRHRRSADAATPTHVHSALAGAALMLFMRAHARPPPLRAQRCCCLCAPTPDPPPFRAQRCCCLCAPTSTAPFRGRSAAAVHTH